MKLAEEEESDEVDEEEAIGCDLPFINKLGELLSPFNEPGEQAL